MADKSTVQKSVYIVLAVIFILTGACCTYVFNHTRGVINEIARAGGMIDAESLENDAVFMFGLKATGMKWALFAKEESEIPPSWRGGTSDPFAVANALGFRIRAGLWTGIAVIIVGVLIFVMSSGGRNDPAAEPGN